MRFSESSIRGAYVIDIHPIEDERGFFARSWCAREFGEIGLIANLSQCSISFNRRKGTLRGMHYQEEPYGEGKVVRCTAGEIYDVIVDLRPESRTFKQWFALTLSHRSHRMIYVPPGVAHGFQSLTDEAEVLYQVSEFYRPDMFRAVRWNDPAFGIDWPPVDRRTISERDCSIGDFTG